MVNVCVWGGGRGSFRSNGFVIKIQPFPMDGHYRTYVINGVGHLRLNSVMSLVLRTVCSTMAGAPTLYYRSVGIASTLLRKSSISGKPYYWTITVTHDYKHILYYIYHILDKLLSHNIAYVL
jgi:hypothetical protein